MIYSRVTFLFDISFQTFIEWFRVNIIKGCDLDYSNAPRCNVFYVFLCFSLSSKSSIK